MKTSIYRAAMTVASIVMTLTALARRSRHGRLD